MRAKRRHHEESAESQDRWLVSYADFITLMFAFFTVLYATSERNVEKTKQFQESIKQFLVRAGGFGGTGEQINQGDKYNTPIEPPIQTFEKTNAATTEVQNSISEQIEGQLSQKKIDEFVIDIAPDEYGVRVVLAANMLFQKEGVALSPQGVAFLNMLGKILMGFNLKMVVEGHSQVGDANASRKLGADRAQEVIRFFSRNAPEKAEKFIAMSFGSQRPLSPKGSVEGERLNERIEIRILTDDSAF